jgi:hypothetical protein
MNNAPRSVSARFRHDSAQPEDLLDRFPLGVGMHDLHGQGSESDVSRGKKPDQQEVEGKGYFRIDERARKKQVESPKKKKKLRT